MRGTAGVLFGARQLCYQVCVCVVRGEIRLSLSLSFRRDINAPLKCGQCRCFFHIFGETTFASRKHALTPVTKKHSSGCKAGGQDKSWAPHVCSTSCSPNLNAWVNRKGCSMPFTVPLVWREPTNHLTAFYFCMVPRIQKGITKKKRGQ
jgi:hypothetical protein